MSWRARYSARPMAKTTRQRLLELMVSRIGSAELARRLGVPHAILNDWINGESSMPDAKLVALVDLIDETAD